MAIRTLIVDDEPIARRGIRRCLEREPDAEIVGECANGREAIAAIDALSPELVFLDIQMPEVDGFEVLEAVGVDRMPAVIFVTAYDQYALKAFEVHALDYLLKPFDADRFHEAFLRARDQIQGRGAAELSRQLLALLRDLSAARNAPRYLTRLSVNVNGRITLVDVAEVDWIEATGNYVTLHVGARAQLVRGTLSNLESRLDPSRFLRISRSVMLNTQRVKEIHPMLGGACAVLLHNGTRLTSSRRFRDRIDAFLKD